MLKKWIKLAGPQMALNAPNVHNKFHMTYSPVVPWDWSADQILGSVPQEAKHLVFNCHGFPWRADFPVPHLSLGTVFHPGNVGAFDQLSSLDTLHVIWLSACSLGSSRAGLDFCQEIARRSLCYVVTYIMGVPDWAARAGHIEDYWYSMPYYIDPMGNPVGRDDFFSFGDDLGFWRD